MSEEELAKAVKGERIGEGLIRITSSLPLSEKIGNASLSGLTKPGLLPGESQHRPAIYLDTETTGLSGGSGTLAFLVGVATVAEERLSLTQLLMTRFAAEATLLSALEQLLPDNHRLVSYNGKSYDLPLLVSRFRMQGRQPDFAQRDHLDLLHPVRRLFGKRWSDCRLTTVERQLLGFSRTDDLPGSEAPEAWFAYLRAGHGDQLVRVVEHNRQDILSLAAIHHVLAEAIRHPHPNRVDIYSLARWLSEIDENQAVTLLQSSIEGLCDDGKRLLGHLLRRAECWEQAVPLWEGLANRGCMDSIERLAKYHEHVSKDLHQAHDYCTMLPGSPQDKRRLERLRGKMVSQQSLSL